MALRKKVKMKGKVIQQNSGLYINKTTNATQESMKITQLRAVDVATPDILNQFNRANVIGDGHNS